MLHFLFQAFCYLSIGAFCLILFARRWPEDYLVENENKEFLFPDLDANARFWAIILWPLFLARYIVTLIHDFFTWLFKVSTKPAKQKLETEAQRAQVEEELRILVQSRAKAEEELVTNRLQ